MWDVICLLISHVVYLFMISHVEVAHGYFAYVNKISFAYPEHLVHEGVASQGLAPLIYGHSEKSYSL